MQNLEKIMEEIAADAGFLEDWFINSVDDSKPVWTDKHIEELNEDFIVIPRGSVQDYYMNDGWIPVEEKLPEESEEFNDVYDPVTLAVIDTKWHKESDIVQVTVYDQDEEKYFTNVDNTYNGEWVTFNLDNFKVIAWKPLSDPYIPEELERSEEE